MKNIITLFFCIITFNLFSQQIHTGKLENGLTYYIHKTSEKQINFHLIQRIGSIVENKNESGYVHFLEHMSFHASKNFPNGIYKFTSNKNITNNASTYKDKVIYALRNVNPQEVNIDSCILILHDWSNFLSLTSDDIETEKKIVYEEWRGDNSNGKLNEDWVNYLYNYSPLSVCSTLGNMEVIKNINKYKLKNFYKKWFTPNLQAVYIEGDVDIAEIENKIKTIFKDCKKEFETAKNEPILIPDNKDTYFKIYNSNKYYSSIEMSSRLDLFKFNSKFDFAKKYIYLNIYKHIINKRITQYDYNSPKTFIQHDLVYDIINKNHALLLFNYLCYSGKEKDCVKQFVNSNNDIRKNGLTCKEKEYVFKNIFNLIETKNSYQIVENNFLHNVPLYSKDYLNRCAKNLLRNFDNQDFIDFCQKNLLIKNNFIISVANEKVNHTIKDDMRKCISSEDTESKKIIVEDVVLKKDVRLEDDYTEKSLPGNIFSFKLKNKLQVYYIPTEDNKTKIYGFAPGGLSAQSYKNIPVAELVEVGMNNVNIENYSPIDINNYLKNEGLSLNFGLEKYFYRIDASSLNKDADKLYKALYNKIKKSKITSNSLKLSKEKKLYDLYSKKDETDNLQQDIASKAFLSYDKKLLLSQAYFDNINKNQFNNYINNRFNNSKNWCFVISSPDPVEKFKNKYLKYFSNIDDKKFREKIKKHRKLKLKKDITKTYPVNNKKGIGGLYYYRYLDKDLDNKEILSFHLLEKIISERCKNEFRHKKKGLYGLFTEGESNLYPENIHSIYINFGANKKYVKEFTQFIDKQFDIISKAGVTEAELVKAKKMFTDKNYQKIKESIILNLFTKMYLKVHSNKLAFAGKLIYKGLVNRRIRDYIESLKRESSNYNKLSLEDIKIKEIRNISKIIINKSKKVEITSY